jgi:undecaprenyl-diphosphatase
MVGIFTPEDSSMTPWQAIVLGIIEGITEFLPISSTGHMIIASSIMGISEDEFVKAFEVIVQAGAILSVVILYWRKFLPNLSFYRKLVVAFLPAAVIGLLLKHKIEQLMGSVQVVAWAMVIGGFILIASDRFFKTSGHKDTCNDLTDIGAFKIGLFQCLAMIPGVSRSAASILGGLTMNLSRKEAAEFSFFLAVPTLAGATAIKLKDVLPTIQNEQWSLLLLGAGVSFIVAAIAIRTFIAIVARYGFTFFGIYRIVVGAVILFMS